MACGECAVIIKIEFVVDGPEGALKDNLGRGFAVIECVGGGQIQCSGYRHINLGIARVVECRGGRKIQIGITSDGKPYF